MNIKLFHQKTCPMCKAVELSLKKHNINYEPCDANEHPEECNALGIKHTPTLMVDDKMLVGHDIIDWINNYREGK